LTFPPEENQDRGPDRYVMDIYIPIACDFLPPKKRNSNFERRFDGRIASERKVR